MKHISLPDFSAARGRRLLVAVSGGADSVALLCMLAEQRQSLHIELAAAHVDHCIRGEESRQDAEFCRALCRRLNVPFYLERVDVPALASGEGLETAARRLRYEALRRIRVQCGAEWIVTAHHLNDQAETVLMHLLRGCGPDGIGGMDVLNDDLYRPLLRTPRRALEAWLIQREIPWRTDSTNLVPDTPRNALRLHGIPALEESYPAAAQAIARYAEAARPENRLMERLTDDFLEQRLERGPYGRRIVSPEAADEAILRRALRRVCALSFDKLTELAALCQKKRGRLDISASLFAERTPFAIYFLPKQPALPPEISLAQCGEFCWEGVGRLTIASGRAIPIRDNPLRQALRRSALEGAVLRTRRDGDRIRPLGCGERLLSDYMTDRKIDRPLRAFVPLIAVGRDILWVVGAGISQEAALHPEDPDALVLEWFNEPNSYST